MSAKSILLLWRHPPYGRGNARDALDIALAFGAFDQSISLLFLGDGAWSLLPAQESSAIAAKSLSQMLPALELYGVDRVYVSEEALRTRSIDDQAITVPVTVLDDNGMADLLAQHELVLSL